jgi:hypothetical protein
MKTKDFNTIIENLISSEIKKNIIEQMEGGKKEVYHIKCDNEPIDTFDTEEEANEHLNKYEKEYPGKQFIIEKGTYESESDMLDKLDEMGDNLQENETQNMKTPTKVKTFVEAILHAKNKGLKSIKIGEESHDIDECWKRLEEEECEQSDMEEESDCVECGGSSTGEQTEQEGMESGSSDLKSKYDSVRKMNPELFESQEPCEDCGKEVCECGNMYESKKKTLRLTEKELVNMVSKIVKESTKGSGDPYTKVVSVPKQNTDSANSNIPGLAVTKTAQTGSKKENDANTNDVGKKMKEYLSFENNDNPEFPHPIGKGEKVARQNTKDQDEEVAKNFAGLQNLEYDIEPSEQFKDRLKKGIEGDSTMGNGPTTQKPTIKPSNGSEKGAEAKDKDGNVIPTPETGKKMEKQMKDRQVDKDNRTLYNKEKVPVNTSKTLNEDIQKMKKLYGYNQKTQ